VVLAWVSSAFRPEPMVFETFAINLVSPPPAVEAPVQQPEPPREELVVERPVETAPQPEPTPPLPPPPQVRTEPTPAPPPRQPEPTPQPRPEPPPQRTPPPPPPEPEPTPTREPVQGPDAQPSRQGGENIMVRMEGLRRDYPEYYNNIVRQIERCYARPAQGSRWQTTVYFVINRNGSVAETRVVTQSGSAAFDLDALGAVECAGRNERFGPLPADLPFDRLPIQFTFSPAGPGQ